MTQLKTKEKSESFSERIKKAVKFPFLMSSRIAGHDGFATSFFDRIKLVGAKDYNSKLTPLPFLKDRGLKIDRQNGGIQYYVEDKENPIFSQEGTDDNMTFRVSPQVAPKTAAATLLAAANDMKLEKIYFAGPRNVSMEIIEQYAANYNENSKPIIFVGPEAKEFQEALRKTCENKVNHEASLSTRMEY